MTKRTVLRGARDRIPAKFNARKPRNATELWIAAAECGSARLGGGRSLHEPVSIHLIPDNRENNREFFAILCPMLPLRANNVARSAV